MNFFKYVWQLMDTDPVTKKDYLEMVFTLKEIGEGKPAEMELTHKETITPGSLKTFQFTGVKDFYGNNICENDQVSLKPFGTNEFHKVRVKYSVNGYWLMVIENSYSTWPFSVNIDGIDTRCEIINE